MIYTPRGPYHSTFFSILKTDFLKKKITSCSWNDCSLVQFMNERCCNPEVHKVFFKGPRACSFRSPSLSRDSSKSSGTETPLKMRRVEYRKHWPNLEAETRKQQMEPTGQSCLDILQSHFGYSHSIC